VSRLSRRGCPTLVASFATEPALSAVEGVGFNCPLVDSLWALSFRAGLKLVREGTASEACPERSRRGGAAIQVGWLEKVVQPARRSRRNRKNKVECVPHKLMNFLPTGRGREYHGNTEGDPGSKPGYPNGCKKAGTLGSPSSGCPNPQDASVPVSFFVSERRLSSASL